MTDHDPARRARRTSIMLTAHVFVEGRLRQSTHRALNLSETGVCIAKPEDLTVGSRVAVTLGQADHVPAQVVWIRAGLAGLRFSQAIDLVKARARRAASAPVTPPTAGWLDRIDNAYR